MSGAGYHHSFPFFFFSFYRSLLSLPFLDSMSRSQVRGGKIWCVVPAALGKKRKKRAADDALLHLPHHGGGRGRVCQNGDYGVIVQYVLFFSAVRRREDYSISYFSPSRIATVPYHNRADPYLVLPRTGWNRSRPVELRTEKKKKEKKRSSGQSWRLLVTLYKIHRICKVLSHSVSS